MKQLVSLALILSFQFSLVYTIDPPPHIGLCIAAPQSHELDRFLEFMEMELAPGGINTLVLRVDYNYAYTSHPELRMENPLTNKEVKQIVEIARKTGIELIPQVNLLGHQSWANKLGKLLEVYPEFDENPSVKMPENYEWPNEDGLYCKSYCPLHQEVHLVLFDIIDEIMEVFEARAFHAGMDEVFYIGEDECPRCSGKNKAELFAGEVNLINEHLKLQDRKLWIWGDRLIDGESTGLGMWEASENDTHHAIDLISKEVVICDWHYERADPTAVLFAMKGFNVITCPWRQVEVTSKQLLMLDSFRENSPEKLKNRYKGIMQTVWNSAGHFMDEYNEKEKMQGPAKSLEKITQHYKMD